jgi:hypothetical protein
MSYQAQSSLETDADFQARNRAAVTQQAATFKDDQRPAFVAVAEAALRGDAVVVLCFVRLAAAGPGIADKVDNGDGTIDQAAVTDADILSLTQANWPAVAGLYFNEDGSPKP